MKRRAFFSCRPAHTHTRHARRNRLALEPLERRLMLDGSPIINEFMADNETTLQDEDGNFSDWIEIYNPTDAAIDLGGWYLTDDSDDLTKWEFPSHVLGPDDYLLVFASDKDRADPGSPLHTNFKLRSGGEYLALVEPDGATVAHQFAPTYPGQSTDVSYGYMHSGATFVSEGDELAYLVPSPQDAGLGTAWTALDFDDSQWTGNSLSSRILITEVGTSSPDFVEIQNVRDEPIDTSGWVVAVNHGLGAPVNKVHPIVWELPDSMAPGEILHRDDAAWGSDIVWSSTGPNWAMIIDDQGNIADFVAWKYSAEDLQSLEVTINGFPITLGDAWSGAGFYPSRLRTGNSIQRKGFSDQDSAEDWAVAPVTTGTPNVDLVTPFTPGIVNGVGFGAALGDAFGTDVSEDMLGVNASLWTRIRFDVKNPELLDELTLQVKYNDAFAAYLNGQPIAGGNAPDSPQWNSTATDSRSVTESLVYEEFDVTPFLGALRAGTNVLAIQGLNDSPGDGEFLLLSHLSGASDAGFLAYMDNPTPGQSNLAGSIASAPEFSQAGGIFTEPFSVQLSADFAPGGIIRYTLDGSIPTEASTEYTVPIPIDNSTQVRARVFQEGMAPSPVATESYVMLDASLRNFSSKLPLVVIDTFGNGVGSKDGQFRSAYMVVLDRGEDGTTKLTTPIDVETRIGIRTRGSSSQGWEKHHYRIEAWNETSGRVENWSNPDERELNDREIAPLGMPPEADWILGSYYRFDRALMRNALIYELSNQVGRYAARTQHVEVFLNTGGSLSYSDYFGVYSLMETIERDDNRVDVAPLDPLNPDHNTPPEVSGGYIFKVDRDDPNSPDTFSAGGLSLVYVDPDVKELTSQQKSYLSSFLNQARSSLIGSSYVNPAFIDVDAWIDHHWLNLLTKNPDAFRLSGYLHKDREGPVATGPVWDFDRTMGCDDDPRAATPTGWNPSSPADDFWRYGWYNYLFQNADFAQRWIDRWAELKEMALSIENIHAVIDAFAAEITQDAANRNFAKWTRYPPNSGGWMGEVNYLKSWLATRVNWIDNQFLDQPRFGRTDGVVDAGTQVTLSGPTGATIYYTLDGSDPRASGGAGPSQNALIYDGNPITVNETQVVTARVWDGKPLKVYSSGPTGGWSPPAEARFIVGTPASADNLAITEINYHPYDPTPAELATQGAGDTPFADEDFEFVELYNTSDETIELAGLKFTEGIDFDFAGSGVTTLGPHEYVVIAKNPAAFEARYGSGIHVAGCFTGQLRNQGERLTLRNDWLDETVLDFRYDDGGNWPGRADGKGASLDLKAPRETDPEDFDKSSAWRSSIAFGGTPGAASAEPLGVVINEVLTHTDPPNVDWIELHNTTAAEIDVGGWYLSDEWGFHTQPVDEDGDGDLEYDTYKKYRIPSGTKIAAGGYLVIDETQFNPNGLWNPQAGQRGINEFALDAAHGDDVWLMAGDAQGNLTHFADHVDFDEAANGESFGRWPNATGDLYPMAELTPEQANTSPRVGPIIISEIRYTPPAGGDEFVELYNPTDHDVQLFDPANRSNTWQFDGIDYWFPEDTVIPAGGVALVVTGDPQTYRTTHDVSPDVQVFGPFRGSLDNAGDRLQLLRPDEPPADDPEYVPYLLVDEVNYESWWYNSEDCECDDGSIYRWTSDAWGNDENSWVSAVPTPGVVSFVSGPGVVGRYVFYNRSAFDGNDPASTAADDAAIAADKAALLPGQTAAFANYTSYSRGINGIMVDIFDPTGAITEDDFRFRVGNNDDPETWSKAPPPADMNVREGAGAGGSDRVVFVWDDHAIRNQWLQVTVLGENLGMATDDVFFFGNAVGESGNSPTDAHVTVADLLLARNNPRSFLDELGIDFHYDYNRDQRVNVTDLLLARNNQSDSLTELRLIDLSGIGGAAASAIPASATDIPAAASLWIYQFDQAGSPRRSSEKPDSLTEAVDKLLSTYCW